MEPPGTTFSDELSQPASNQPFEFSITIDSVDHSPKVLPPGQRLFVNDTGCAAGDGELLACITGDHHGFVVAASGSWAF